MSQQQQASLQQQQQQYIGEYQIIGRLGEGAFSEVFKARKQTISDRFYALKRFKKRYNKVEEIELLRETQALRRLHRHENIVQLEEVIFDAKYAVLTLVFEMMQSNLYELLSRKGQPPVRESHAKMILWQVMKALDFIHGKGVFHRDIKPENILVNGDVNALPAVIPLNSYETLKSDSTSLSLQKPQPLAQYPLIVKLADFGSCRGIQSRMPYTEYIATRWYRAPECLLYDGIYTFKMDIWGLSCVFFELLTKIPLFPGDNELDQLSKIHNVLGGPSDQLISAMTNAGTQAMIKANSGPNPKPMPANIMKKSFTFAESRGTGLRAAFPPYVLYGAQSYNRFVQQGQKMTGTAKLFNISDYPGISDDCVNLIELMLQYDPDARPSTKLLIKHPWLKEYRDHDAVLNQPKILVNGELNQSLNSSQYSANVDQQRKKSMYNLAVPGESQNNNKVVTIKSVQRSSTSINIQTKPLSRKPSQQSVRTKSTSNLYSGAQNGKPQKGSTTQLQRKPSTQSVNAKTKSSVSLAAHSPQPLRRKSSTRNASVSDVTKSIKKLEVAPQPQVIKQKSEIGIGLFKRQKSLKKTQSQLSNGSGKSITNTPLKVQSTISTPSKAKLGSNKDDSAISSQIQKSRLISK
ncbi:hypothetical protein MIR68_001496 [Amoeboaphelidium protococcarum]|nr:hypothetical protein MIR68_001496 [Amoeboaphelidium protococcarum]